MGDPRYLSPECLLEPQLDAITEDGRRAAELADFEDSFRLEHFAPLVSPHADLWAIGLVALELFAVLAYNLYY